jgi:hypothetical protein
MGDISRQMLVVDEPLRLLLLYRRLALDVGGYLLRNLGGLLCAGLPVVAFLLYVAPPALTFWDRHTTAGVALYPLAAAQELAQRGGQGESLSVALDITNTAPSQPSFKTTERTAVCWSTVYCTIFRLLCFRVIETSAAVVQTAPYLVLRPQHGDMNWLWPYFNDVEFVFVCVFMAAAVVSFFRGRTA